MKRYPWIPVIVVSLLILTLTSIPKIPSPPKGFHSLDKIAHFLIYLLWGFTLSRVWKERSPRRKSFVIFICSAPLLFPALDESHQFLIPGRTPSLLDLGCDIAGAFLGFSIFARWKHTRDA